MGMNCCCDARISANEPCTCNWEGWNRIKHSINDSPKKSGIYLVRCSTNSGDKYECEMEFSSEPYRYDTPMYGSKIPIHWKETSWDDDLVYAWKEIDRK